MTETGNLIDTAEQLDSFVVKERMRAVPPLVSIFLPVTHEERTGRLDEATRILFKDLANQARAKLEAGWPGQWEAIDGALEFLETHDDLPYWLEAKRSLGFLISNDELLVHNLSIDVEPTVVVGDFYYFKPLLAQEAAAASYYLLALSSDRFGIIEGDENGVHRIDLPEEVIVRVSETFPALDGTEGVLDDADPNGHDSPYHLWHSRHDVKEAETEKFFRAVDDALADTIFKECPTPLILVTLPEHQSVYRSISHLTNLMPDGIEKDPNALSGAELRDDAMAIRNKYELEAQQALLDRFAEDLAHGKATKDITEIGPALVERKVETLLLADGAELVGAFDYDTGEIVQMVGTHPEITPDLIDGMVQATLAQGGEVAVLPAYSMPGGVMAAAIYRY